MASVISKTCIEKSPLYITRITKRSAPYILVSLFALYITATVVVEIPWTENFQNRVSTEISSNQILRHFYYVCLQERSIILEICSRALLRVDGPLLCVT